MTNRDRFNIKIYKGESFTMQCELRDANGSAISLQGATISSECRSKQSNVIVFNFSCAIITPASNGIFTISLPALSSSNLQASRNLVYDVKISFAGGEVKKWLSGDVEVIDTITQ